MAEGTRMLQRRGTSAEWDLSSYVLAEGEIGVATDTGGFKVGDGVNVWASLPNPYDSAYLPLEGTAVNSNLLGGISSAGFLQADDGEVNPNPSTIALRDVDGKLQAVAGEAGLEVINFAQMTQALIDNNKNFFQRVFADATTSITLAVGDENRLMLVTNNSSSTVRVINIPTTATADIPNGSWIDICNQGTGVLKLVPAGGLVLRGPTYIFGGSSVMRLYKTSSTEWLAVPMGNQEQGRLPKMRVYRNTGTNYNGGVYTAVPYTTIDSAETFNPSDSFFSIDPVGLLASRRIIVNQDGEYFIAANFYNNLSAANSGYLRINRMNGNNNPGNPVASGSGTTLLHLCARIRLTAGQSVGVTAYGTVNFDDFADSASGNKNDMTITKIGD